MQKREIIHTHTRHTHTHTHTSRLKSCGQVRHAQLPTVRR